MSRRRSIIAVILLVKLSSSLADSQVTWTRYPLNPIFSTSTANPNSIHNPYFAFGPAVLWDQTQRTYLGWFETLPGNAVNYSISHALSMDGALWYYCSYSPAIEPSNRGFDSQAVRGPSVIKDATGYKMYYSATDGSPYTIGLATSTDGVRWRKYSANPVFKPGPPGAWDDAGVLFCKVLLIGSEYYMWYSGRDGFSSRIGVATSSDGLSWTRHRENPVLDVGAAGEWDGFFLEAPAIAIADGFFYMLYTARPQMRAQQIGLATSTDGLTWKKYSGNPVFSGQAIWEGINVAVSSLVFREDTFHLWYSANGSGKWQAGYATSQLEYPPNPRPNAITNPGFEFGRLPWTFSGSGTSTFAIVRPGHYSANAARISSAGSEAEIQLAQSGLVLEPNTVYRLSFAACSNMGHDLSVTLDRSTPPHSSIGADRFVVDLSPAWRRFSTVFTTTGFSIRTADIRIQFRPHGGGRDQFFIDDTRIAKTLQAELMPEPTSRTDNVPVNPYLRCGLIRTSAGNAQVEIGLPSSGYATLELFDALGRSLGTLLESDVPAGRHSLRFDSRGFPAGIYFYRLATDSGNHPALQGKLLFLN